MTTVIRPYSHVLIEGQMFPVESGRVTLDLSRSPYAMATFDLPWSDAVADIIRHPSSRVGILGREALSGTERLFELLVTEGSAVKSRDGRCTITATSDEALLHAYAPLGPDSGSLEHSSSARAVTNYVLGKFNFTLEPSTVDIPLPSTTDPDVFTWQAGDSAWEFLRPILTSVGLMLFCDERRRWYLIDPAAYAVPGNVDLTAPRVTAQTDRTVRADKPDGVVCIYRWSNAAGEQLEHREWAGAHGNVLVFNYDRPWPGDGAAARILARRSQRGRSQTLTAVVDWAATPGMTTTGADATLGRIQAVEFGLTGGLMNITREGDTE